DDDVRDVLVRRRHQCRRVGRDAYDLDVVVGVQERADTLADQHVVLAEHHPDRHVATRSPCTMRPCCASCSPRITTLCGRAPRRCCTKPRTSTSSAPPPPTTSCSPRSSTRPPTRC